MLAYRQFLLLLLVALAACAGTPAQTETPLFTANARAEGSQNVDVIVEEVARYSRGHGLLEEESEATNTPTRRDFLKVAGLLLVTSVMVSWG